MKDEVLDMGRDQIAPLAAFGEPTQWLNSEPLTPARLDGEVVLVQFCTYTCINWIRTLPYVRAWAERYRDQGLVVVGVHTPEFPFEQDVDNVREALKDMNVSHPIAIDNDYAIWSAFDNQYWPALYFVDATGRIRHHRFGEGDYEQSEEVIQRLLAESGAADVDRDLVSVDGVGVEAAADWDSLQSPETYLGYRRPESVALAGDWTVEHEASVLHEANGRIAYRFEARDLHLVMGPATRGAPVRFRVLVDGRAPGPAHGLDVDEQGNGTVAEQRLYQLVRQPGPVTERGFEITFLAPGVEAYVFTFG